MQYFIIIPVILKILQLKENPLLSAKGKIITENKNEYLLLKRLASDRQQLFIVL